MKEYTLQAKRFYNSSLWKRTRKNYLESVHYICERCGKPADIVHHRKHINLSNINNLNILIGFDNLEALCLNCHNKEHFANRVYQFDNMGNLISDTRG